MPLKLTDLKYRGINIDELKSVFKLDTDDWCIRWKCNVGKRGIAGQVAGITKLRGKQRYLRIVYKKIGFYTHKLIWLLYYNEIPFFQLDHIDGNRLNNSITNLRKADQNLNNKNAANRKDNVTGIRGVSWCKSKNKYCAQAWFNKKYYFLGYFDNLLDAMSVRKAANIYLGFHENHGRLKCL